MLKDLESFTRYITDLSIKNDKIALTLIVYLAISQIYYSYRYILGYGSTATSQIVRDTPIEFQLGKYIITGIFYLVTAFVLLSNRHKYYKYFYLVYKNSKLELTVLAVVILYLGVSLVKFDLNFFDFAFKEIAKAEFFIPVALIFFFVEQKERLIQALSKLTLWALFYQVIGFALTYIGLVVFDKLPAQSYPGQFIRFGGIWDDPNAFAFFLLIPFFLLLVVGDAYKKYKNLAIIGIFVITVMIFLSLSLTSWIAGAVGVLVLLVINRTGFRLRSVSLVIAIFIILGLFSPYSRTFVYSKIASFQARVCSILNSTNQSDCQKFLEQFGILGDFNFGYVTEDGVKPDNPPAVNDSSSVSTTLIGKSGNPIFNENYYLAIFFNYGLVGVSLFGAVLLLALRRARNLYRKSADSARNYLGLFSLPFIGALSVGMMALPYPAMYPINIYIWLIIVLLFSIPVDKINKQNK